MNWKDLFNRRILERGQDYYLSGHVKNYKRQYGNCTAQVKGSMGKYYTVTVSNIGFHDMEMTCDCPYAQDGMKCKHMAAVMFRIDEDTTKRPGDADRSNKQSVKRDVLIREPIPKAQTEHVPYFHLADICDGFSVLKSDFELAKTYEKKIRIDVDIYYMQGYGNWDAHNKAGKVIGSLEDVLPEYAGKHISAQFDRKRLETWHCPICNKGYDFRLNSYNAFSYGSVENRKTLCPHIMALLLATDNYMKKYDPADETDYQASLVLSAFEKNKDIVEGRSDSRVKDVRIEPKIEETGLGYEVSFRIGNNSKLYVITNLTDFYETVSDKGIHVLGKSGCIDFSKEDFDDSSAGLYALIEKEVRKADALEEKMESRYRYNYGTVTARRTIPFQGDVPDAIYEERYGEKVDFKGNGSNKLLVCDAQPSVSINIETKKPDKLSQAGSQSDIGIIVSGRVPRVIDGIKARYYIENDHLSKLDSSVAERIRPFAEVADEDNGSFKFCIGKRMMREFYYEILPGLRKDDAFLIKEKKNVADVIPPEAEFSFWLDYVDGHILCKVLAGYVVGYKKKDFLVKPVDMEKYPMPECRDQLAEDRIRDLIFQFFNTYYTEDNLYGVEADDDVIYDILQNCIPKIADEGEVNMTDAFSRLNIKRKFPVMLGVSVDSGLMDLTIKTTDVDPAELVSVLDSYTKKKNYHRLKNGTFIDLNDNDSIDALMSMLETMNISVKDFVKGKLEIPAYRALYLDKMLEEHDEVTASRDRRFRSLVKNFKTIDDSDYEVPDSLSGTLREYQDYGFKWLKTLEQAGFSGILADDMGLGKTLEVITLILADKQAGEDVRVLVVCPASVVYNWVEEVRRFAPKLSVTAVAGTKDERLKLLEPIMSSQEHPNGEGYIDESTAVRKSEDTDSKRVFDVYVTSYELLKRDIGLYDDIRFTHQIADEAQFIKNAKAVGAKAMKHVRAEHKIALTGTPIENRLAELWSIFDYLMPGFLYGYESFRKDYEMPITKNQDEVKTAALKNMVSPFILRRKKEDVLKDLPEKTEEIHYVRFEEEQQKLYDGQVVRIKGMIGEDSAAEFERDKIRILAELTRIRQICCDPGLLFSDYGGESAKREACMDLIQSAVDGGHKMLVFSQFTSMLDILQDDLKKSNIQYYLLTGTTSKEERARLVKAFNTDDTPVFLISLKAGGTGLNITGADIVIHYDPWWNFAAQNQATDRAHRIGQTKNVTVYKLIAKDSIEENIIKLQESKKELADAIINGEGKSLGQMSREELLNLIG